MNITNYIVEFLKQGKSVEIKGIGTFVPKTIPTRFDNETNTYYPSIKTVEFTTLFKGNVQIIDYIAKQEFVGITTAEKLWENYVVALTEKMKTTSKHEFPGLGELMLDQVSGYSFKLYDKVNFSKETKHLLPLTNISTFVPAADRVSPFERFDNPVIPQKQEEEPVEEEELVDESMENIPMTESVEEALTEEMAGEQIETETQEVEPRQLDPEEAAAKHFSMEFGEEIAKLSAMEAEMKKVAEDDDNDEEESSSSIAQQGVSNDNNDGFTTVSGGRKKKFPKVLVLLLIILLLGGGAFYYFIIYKGVQIPFIGGTTEAEETEAIEATEGTVFEEQLSDVQDVTTIFTYDYALISVSGKDRKIEDVREEVMEMMRAKLYNFLKREHYTSANAAMTTKLNEYVVMRLSQLFDDDVFHPAKFVNYDDYIRNYCANNLEKQRVSRAKTTIISEIKKNNVMEDLLNELIDEGVVEKDVIVVPVKVPEPTPTADIRVRSKQGFDVIAGFFKSRDNAVRLAARMRKKGTDAYVISNGNHYYVSLGSASSRTGAEALLKQLRTWNKENMVIKKW